MKEDINILSFDTPEHVGIDRNKLSEIDSIISYAIENEMTPGAQILVAKNSRVIYEKSNVVGGMARSVRDKSNVPT